MKKADLFQAVHNKSFLSREKSKAVVENILKILSNTIEAGEEVQISSFGRFSVRQKKERIGRNPRTREAHVISSRRVLQFTPSKVWRKKLNSQDQA